MRKPMIAGNWKMNKTPAETVALVEDLKKIQVRTKAEVVVCPMTVSLFAAATQLKGTDIKPVSYTHLTLPTMSWV